MASEIGALRAMTERSMEGMPQGDGGLSPVATYFNEIGSTSMLTEKSMRDVTQGGGAQGSVATNDDDIGGQSEDGQQAYKAIAPKRRGRPRKVAPVDPIVEQFAATVPVTERSSWRVPQGGGGPSPAATNTDQTLGGPKALDRKVHTAAVPKLREPRPIVAPAPLSEIVDRIVILQRERKFCISTQSKLERSTEAYIARHLGYSPDMPDDERKAIWAKASSLRKKVEGGSGGGQPAADRKVQHEHAPSTFHRLILQAAASRAPWDEFRSAVEAEMEGLAKQLPVWSWVAEVKGFGAKGLAIILGEAGADLSAYSSREKLWKRLGLAVMDGKRQGKPGEGASAQDWIDHGYNKKRRAEIWAIADSMFKQVWRGDKDEDGKNPVLSKKPMVVPAHALTVYGAIYGNRKAKTGFSNQPMTPKHRDNDARRLMTKALIEDLWRVWNGGEARKRQIEIPGD